MRFFMYPGLSVLLIIMAGCSKTLPVIPDPVACAFPNATLDENCEEPVTIKDGMTYSDLIAAPLLAVTRSGNAPHMTGS